MSPYNLYLIRHILKSTFGWSLHKQNLRTEIHENNKGYLRERTSKETKRKKKILCLKILKKIKLNTLNKLVRSESFHTEDVKSSGSFILSEIVSEKLASFVSSTEGRELVLHRKLDGRETVEQQELIWWLGGLKPRDRDTGSMLSDACPCGEWRPAL